MDMRQRYTDLSNDYTCCAQSAFDIRQRSQYCVSMLDSLDQRLPDMRWWILGYVNG